MRCYICDKELSDAEVMLTPDKKGFEPCSVCLDIAMEAAYSDGFQRPDEEDEIPIVDVDVDELSFQQLSFIEGWSEPSPLFE